MSNILRSMARRLRSINYYEAISVWQKFERQLQRTGRIRHDLRQRCGIIRLVLISLFFSGKNVMVVYYRTKLDRSKLYYLLKKENLKGQIQLLGKSLLIPCFF